MEGGEMKTLKFLSLLLTVVISFSIWAQSVSIDHWYEDSIVTTYVPPEIQNPQEMVGIKKKLENGQSVDAILEFKNKNIYLPVQVVSIDGNQNDGYQVRYRPGKLSASNVKSDGSGQLSFNATPNRSKNEGGISRPSKGSGAGTSQSGSLGQNGSEVKGDHGDPNGYDFGNGIGDSLLSSGVKVAFSSLAGIQGEKLKGIYNAIGEIQAQIGEDLQHIEDMKVELNEAGINLSINLKLNSKKMQLPILNTERIHLVDVQIGTMGPNGKPYFTGPVQPYGFRTSALSEEGQLLNNLAIDYAEEWNRREGFAKSPSHEAAVYFSGAVLLQSADSQFFSGDITAGKKLVNASKFLLQVSKGFVEGFYNDGALALIESLPGLAMTLKELSDNIDRAMVDPKFAEVYFPELANKIIVAVPEIADQMVKDIIKDFNTLKSGSAYDRARLLGRITFDRIVDTVTTGATRGLGSGRILMNRGVRNSIRTSTKKALEKSIGNSDFSQMVRGRALIKKIDSAEISHQAGRFSDIRNALSDKGLAMTPNSQDYLANILANEGKFGLSQFTNSDLTRLTKNYLSLETKFGGLKTTDFKGYVHRTIPKQVMINGNQLKNLSPSDIFKLHEGGIFANGRVSMPGQQALYTMIGKDFTDIQDVLMKEVGAANLSKHWKGSALFESKNILDLSTHSDIGKFNLKQLGISSDSLLDANDMLLPQALSHIANEFDMEGLILPSRHNKDVLNLNVLYK